MPHCLRGRSPPKLRACSVRSKVRSSSSPELRYASRCPWASTLQPESSWWPCRLPQSPAGELSEDDWEASLRSCQLCSCPPNLETGINRWTFRLHQHDDQTASPSVASMPGRMVLRHRSTRLQFRGSPD